VWVKIQNVLRIYCKTSSAICSPLWLLLPFSHPACNRHLWVCHFALRPRSHLPVFDRPADSDYRWTKHWNTGQHMPNHTTQSFGRPGRIYRPTAGQQQELSTTMAGRQPVAESAVVQVLLTDTFTHSGFYPAVSERSLSIAVSVEY
jgi:hypothetical protein